MLDRAQEIVSPSGEDAVVRSTVPAKPPVDCNETVVDPESPAGKERSGSNTRTSIVAEWTRVPLVPVIVTAYVPVLFAVSVQVEVPFPVRLDGTHEVVMPEGTDAAVKLTVPAKPPVDEREIVELADCPIPNDTLVGIAEIPKSGPPGWKNSTGEGAVTSFWPRFPPPQTSSRSLANE